MRALVKQAYDEMIHGAKDEGLVPPSTMALLVSPKNGYLFHSSIKNRKPTGRALLNNCDDKQHRYQGNCAELSAVDEVHGKWDLKGAYLAVYGIEDLHSGKANWLSPCGDKDGKTGCDTVLASQDFVCITKRGLELVELDGSSDGTLNRRTILERATPLKAPAGKTSKTSPAKSSGGKAACKGSKVKRFVAEPGPEISLSFRRSLASVDEDWLDLFE